MLKAKAKLSSGELSLSRQSSNSSSKSGGKAPQIKQKGKGGKMEATIDNSKFRGLATVVEMMMDHICPANLH